MKHDGFQVIASKDGKRVVGRAIIAQLQLALAGLQRAPIRAARMC
jgi:hypothetical protein